MKTKIIKTDSNYISAEALQEAVRVISQGGLVIIPTETVYGIVVDANNEEAIARLRRVKERPHEPFAHLIPHVGAMYDLAGLQPTSVYKVVNHYWPGPLTVIINHEGQETTIGLRMPDHPVALALLQEANVPFAAPSANLIDQPPPITCAAALEQLDGLVDLAIDAGPVQIGTSSTIIDFTKVKPEILRQGKIALDEVNHVMNQKRVLFVCTGNSCRSVMAEYMLKAMAEDKENLQISSAGIAAMNGAPASQQAVEALREEGANASVHQSRPVTQSMLRESDLILAMTQSHRNAILNIAPDVEQRLYLLREFAQQRHGEVPMLDIPDPVGQPLSVYRHCLEVIKESLNKVKNLL